MPDLSKIGPCGEALRPRFLAIHIKSWLLVPRKNTRLKRKSLSHRQYAARRGVSRQLIDRWCREGVLPVEVDGSIDPIKADRALSKRAGRSRADTLANARLRRLHARVAIAQDEVDRLKSRAVPPAEPVAAFEAMAERIRTRLDDLVRDVAPRAAGQPAAVAKEMLTKAVRVALHELAETEVAPVEGESDTLAFAGAGASEALPRRGRRAAAPGRRTQEPTATDLGAKRAELAAERLELRLALRRGELVDLFHQVYVVVTDRLLNTRSYLLALPTKAAPRLEACSADEAERLLGDEIAQALEELDWPIDRDFPAWKPWMLEDWPELPKHEIHDQVHPLVHGLPPEPARSGPRIVDDEPK